MDRRRKWKYRTLAGLQVLAAAVIAGALIFLLYRYVRYGEQFAREAGAPGQADVDDSGAEGAEKIETEGTEKAGAEDSGGQTAGTKGSGGQTDGAEDGKLPDTIRVRILADDFSEECHERVDVTSGKAFAVRLDGKRVRKGKAYGVNASDLEEGQVLELEPEDGALLTVESLARADGHPQYAGALWLYREEDGLALVNELPLEEYLCGVVSSEMPSDYPEEAQKAQAVCARTYAYNCIRNARAGNSQESHREDRSEAVAEDASGNVEGDTSEDVQGASQRYITADLDDSVNYQVYNNYRATAQSRQAVEATRGEILPLDEILYYSTSCLSEHREDLDSDEAFREFLEQEPDAGAEYDSPWLRWETEILAQDILQELSAGYGWQADRIDEIRVTKRAGNGQVQELALRCGDFEKKIEGEYAVRQVLSAGQAAVRLRDGEEHPGMPLLPSAFFWMETVRAQEAEEQQESEGAQRADGQQEQSGEQKADGQQEQSGVQEADERQEPDRESAAEAGEERELPIDRVVIHGGGYGHGVGMSQCGAAAMAKKGLDYRQILEYYYSCEPSD